LALHCRTLPSLQKRAPAWQTTGAQEAAMHTWLLAAQSAVTLEERPSAEHSSTFSDCGSQERTKGAQTWSLHEAMDPAATQVWLLAQGASGKRPPPSALQVATAFD